MNKSELIILGIFAVVMIFLFGIYLSATLVDSEGTLYLHKYTNIVCNYYYDGVGFTFERNTTEVQNFIQECKDRGIGG